MSAKILFSAREHSLLQDADIILTKRVVIDKVYVLFSEQIPFINDLLRPFTLAQNAEIGGTNPKIYKGENLDGLPYVMMDHPALFSTEHIFAVRTFFWWGRYMAVYVLAKGKYQEYVNVKTSSVIDEAINNSLFFCVNEDPWRHDFEEDNFLPLSKNDFHGNRDFIKLGYKIPFSQNQNYDSALAEAYKAVVSFIK